MPKSKFPDRRDGTYYIEGGQYVSVTAVLTALAKPALINWAAKRTAAGILADPDKFDTVEKAATIIVNTREGAADRGKALHNTINRWALTGELPQPDPVDPYLTGFLAFARAWAPKPIYSEVNVFSNTRKYAGRLDLIAQIGQETWILDFKTSKGIWPEMGLQLAAYRNAEWLRMEDGTVYPMPVVDQAGVVSIPGDGTFDFKTMDEPFDVFLALMHVYNWTKVKAQ